RSARRFEAPGRAVIVAARRGAGVSGVGGDAGDAARLGGDAAGPRRGGGRKALPRALRRRVMSGCQTDGDLPADGGRGVPAPDRGRVASHLAVCGGCDARYRAIEARAARVAIALSALAGGIVEPLAGRQCGTGALPAASKVRLWPRWAAAAGM